MPLSAYVNGEREIASLLGPSEWDKLRAKKPAIELACCRSRGFMRVSKLGTQHFVHARRSDRCSPAPESAEHLLLKSIILRTVREAGWNGDVEVCGPDGAWRADVMATKANLRVAFEIQLSTIPFCELAARQQAYADDNVRGCWFYGHGALNPPPPPKTEIPVFPLSFSGENPFGSLNQSMPPIRLESETAKCFCPKPYLRFLTVSFGTVLSNGSRRPKGSRSFSFTNAGLATGISMFSAQLNAAQPVMIACQ